MVFKPQNITWPVEGLHSHRLARRLLGLPGLARPLVFQSLYRSTARLCARLAERFGLYPGFVLNGKEWRTWSRSKSIPQSTTKAGVLKVTSTDLRNWDVTFSPTRSSGETYEAHTALLASGLASDVKAGENKGRRLEHDFVVTRLKPYLLREDGNQARARIELELAKEETTKSSALVVWITHSGRLEPLQPSGGWLPSKRYT